MPLRKYLGNTLGNGNYSKYNRCWVAKKQSLNIVYIYELNDFSCGKRSYYGGN